jgi:hypothetical protein
MTWENIKQSKKLQRAFKKEFIQTLKECDEEVIESILKIDYILHVFETQGYWSAVNYNISFDTDLGFTYEQRRFSGKENTNATI